MKSEKVIRAKNCFRKSYYAIEMKMYYDWRFNKQLGDNNGLVDLPEVTLH